MPAFALEPVARITITTLMDNVSDMLLSDTAVAKRASLTDRAPRVPMRFWESGSAPDYFQAEHGFSALVGVTIGGGVRYLLFDTGLSPEGMVRNMARLTLSPRDIEAVVLSHGHFDHTGGLDGLERAVGRAGMPLLLHPQFWNRRRVAIPGAEPRELPTTSKSALLGAGFQITEEQRPSFVFARSVLITGEVDRTTPFEQGMAYHEKLDAGGAWQPDPLILDDQAMVLHLHGRGLVVLTGCGHAGIINIVRYAQALTGVTEIYAVIGGFHLSGPRLEPIIDDVCAALVELAPSVVVPAHCTGWRAVHRLAAALPDAFVQNSVGTRLMLDGIERSTPQAVS